MNEAIVNAERISKYAPIFKQIEFAINEVKEVKAGGQVVIALAGAGCLGKSTFAESLRSYLGCSRCTVYPLDAWMLPRQNASGLTGYNPARFELDEARINLQTLIRDGKSVIVYDYNRRTHQRTLRRQIEPTEVIIIEGGLALREEFYDLSDIRIFLDADEQTQHDLRLTRETVEFGYPPEGINRFEERFRTYIADYQRFIEPTRARADIILSVNRDFEVHVMKPWGQRGN